MNRLRSLLASAPLLTLLACGAQPSTDLGADEQASTTAEESLIPAEFAHGTERSPGWVVGAPAAIGDRLAFSWTVAHKHHLLITDGTAAGTTALTPSGENTPDRFKELRSDGTVAYALRYGKDPTALDAVDVWRTDGTPEGTSIVGRTNIYAEISLVIDGIAYVKTREDNVSVVQAFGPDLKKTLHAKRFLDDGFFTVEEIGEGRVHISPHGYQMGSRDVGARVAHKGALVAELGATPWPAAIALPSGMLTQETNQDLHRRTLDGQDLGVVRGIPASVVCMARAGSQAMIVGALTDSFALFAYDGVAAPQQIAATPPESNRNDFAQQKNELTSTGCVSEPLGDGRFLIHGRPDDSELAANGGRIPTETVDSPIWFLTDGTTATGGVHDYHARYLVSGGEAWVLGPPRGAWERSTGLAFAPVPGRPAGDPVTAAPTASGILEIDPIDIIDRPIPLVSRSVTAERLLSVDLPGVGAYIRAVPLRGGAFIYATRLHSVGFANVSYHDGRPRFFSTAALAP